MKQRDSLGRFSKQNESGALVLTFPTFTTLLYWISLIFIFLPWFMILSKFSILEKISTIFDSIFREAEATEPNEKN